VDRQPPRHDLGATVIAGPQGLPRVLKHDLHVTRSAAVPWTTTLDVLALKRIALGRQEPQSPPALQRGLPSTRSCHHAPRSRPRAPTAVGIDASNMPNRAAQQAAVIGTRCAGHASTRFPPPFSPRSRADGSAQHFFAGMLRLAKISAVGPFSTDLAACITQTRRQILRTNAVHG